VRAGWSQKTAEHNYPDDYYNSGGYRSGYEWRQTTDGTTSAYYIDPNHVDGKTSSEGATMYAVVHHAAQYEGQYGSGAVYDNNESIATADMAGWYTAYNSDGPCELSNPPEVNGPSNLVASNY
jgi:hypothetical protein